MARLRERDGRPLGLWVSGALVGVLTIGVVALVILAVMHTRGAAETASPRPVPTFTPVTSGPSPTPTPTPTVAPAPGAAERFLSAGSGRVLWRATAGDCNAVPPLLERSEDGGRTWRDVTPHYRGVGQISSLDAFAGTEGEMVASLGPACEVQLLRTFTEGRFWDPYPDVLRASTYVNPADTAEVVTPSGPVPAPCASPYGLRAGGDPRAVALICDGRALTLSGDRWTDLGVTDAVALALTPDGVAVGHEAPGCEGLALTTVAPGATPPPSSDACVADVDPSLPVAIAAGQAGFLVWSGDAIVGTG